MIAMAKRTKPLKDRTSLGWTPETIADIMEQLKPWRQIDPTSPRLGGCSDAEVAEIRAGPHSALNLAVTIELLNLKIALVGLDRESIIATRKRMRGHIGAIDKLQKRFTGLDKKVLSNLYDELTPARRKCEEIVEQTNSDGLKAGIKRECAWTAYEMIQEYSTKKPTNGSANCSFRVITSLLYGISPQVEDSKSYDFRHICNDVLKSARNGTYRKRGKEFLWFLQSRADLQKP